MSNKIFEYINKLNQTKLEDSLSNLLQEDRDKSYPKQKRNLVPILITIIIFLSIILSGILILQYYPKTLYSLIERTKSIPIPDKIDELSNTINISELSLEKSQNIEAKSTISNNATSNITLSTENLNLAMQITSMAIKHKENKNKTTDLLAESTSKISNNATQITVKKEENVGNQIRLNENDLYQLYKEQEARRKRLLNQAENYRNKGDYNSALNLYKIVWEEYKDPDAANNLGAFYILMQRYEEAKNILEEAKKIKPDDPDINYNLMLLEEIYTNR